VALLRAVIAACVGIYLLNVRSEPAFAVRPVLGTDGDKQKAPARNGRRPLFCCCCRELT